MTIPEKTPATSAFPSSAATVRSRGPLKKTLVYGLAHTINDTYPNLYPILLPVLMAQMGFGIAAAGLISTVTALTTQLLQPVMGYWADRVGGRGFVIGGLVFGSVLTAIALGWAPSYQLLLVLLMIGGLGNSAFHPHASALVGEISTKRKGLSMSVFMIGGNFGRALAPIIASSAYAVGGRPGLFLVGAPGLVMALIMTWVMSPPPAAKPRKDKLISPEFIKGLRQAGGLLVVVGLRSMTTLSVLTLMPILWQSWNRPMTETATLLSLLFIAGSIGNVIGGAVSDSVGAKPVLVASAVLTSVWLFLLINTQNTAVDYVLVALLGASLYSTGSVIMVFGQALFPNNKGMASGLTLGIGNTLGSLGVGAVGLVADYYSPLVGLTFVACAMLVIIPFVVRLKLSAGHEGTVGS